MSWYKNVTAATGRVVGPNYEVLDAFSIKDQLKSIGFRWDGNRKVWYKDKSLITRSPNDLKLLKSLGLDLSGPAPVTPVQPPQTTQPVPGEAIPDCPKCGLKMTLRTRNDGTGRQFWGCSSFPRCNGIRPYKADSGNWYDKNVRLEWILVKKLSDGTPIAVAEDGKGNWSWVDPSWKVSEPFNTYSDSQAKASFEPIFDNNGAEYKSFDPLELFAKFKEISPESESIPEVPDENVAENLEETVEDDPNYEAQRVKNMIPEHRMSDEQRAIDKVFGETKDSIMVDALAGSGKTTMLKHLAWKYANKGQRWLYMVFNTKNKVEATEKFPTSRVTVDTSNGFLGRVLQRAAREGKVPATNRVKSLEEIEAKRLGLKSSRALSKKQQAPDKSHSLADSRTFAQQLYNYGLMPQDNTNRIRDDVLRNTVKAMVEKVRGDFRKAITKLTSLCKSFAIDPRKPGLTEKITSVLDKYDVDCELEDVKERINGYKGNYGAKVIREINAIFGFNIMTKSLRNECIQSVEWMLKQSLPGGTTETFVYGGKTHRLADFRDFDDDLWYTAIDAEKMNWTSPGQGRTAPYTHVLADEVQDFNECQKIALAHMRGLGSRVVAVGDPNQCHPAGTLISLTGGGKKPIEEIKVGDELVTYNSKKSYFPGVSSQGRKVEEISSRDYSGDMITITASNISHDCTPNHKCVVRFNANDKYCLYLMKRATSFRIGMCKVKYLDKFGVVGSAISEGADKAWLLDIFDTEEDAKITEVYMSCSFGIPQTLFKNNGQKSSKSQLFFDKIYARFGDLTLNAEKCLRHFGRDMAFPIWSKDEHEKQSYIGTKKSFITQACNLISRHMEVRTFDGTIRGGMWERIEISRKLFTGNVYSLKVAATEGGKRLYIANGITTHNSIYRFRGADESAFGNIAKMLGSQKHTLSKNFRSRPAIINFSNDNTKVKNLKLGLKVSKEDLDAYMTGYQKSPKDVDYMAQAKDILGGPVTPDTLKAACDAGTLPWPPMLNGQATREQIEYDQIFDQIAAEHKAGQQQQTAFICRTNAPLANSALKLLGNGTPFVIVGKDIAADLTKHIGELMRAKIRGYDAIPLTMDSSMSSLADKLHMYLDQEVAANSNKASKQGWLQDLKDTTNALEACIGQFDSAAISSSMGEEDENANFVDSFNPNAPVPQSSQSRSQPTGGKTIAQFRKWLDEKLGTNSLNIDDSEADVLKYMDNVEKDKKHAPVVLTSSHKSKGLEFERVFVLRDDLFPHPRAKRNEDLEQEENAKYVTYTRAMNQLHVIKLEGQPGYKK